MQIKLSLIPFLATISGLTYLLVGFKLSTLSQDWRDRMMRQASPVTLLVYVGVIVTAGLMAFGL